MHRTRKHSPNPLSGGDESTSFADLLGMRGRIITRGADGGRRGEARDFRSTRPFLPFFETVDSKVFSSLSNITFLHLDEGSTMNDQQLSRHLERFVLSYLKILTFFSFSYATIRQLLRLGNLLLPSHVVLLACALFVSCCYQFSNVPTMFPHLLTKRYLQQKAIKQQQKSKRLTKKKWGIGLERHHLS
mmetsp:Transcript_28618/g.73040  ORF Transcript_28618/g.73040 Transcript_28618/m.73040 type:complete len:188 (+) Transcript_28618:2847-3410(+)